MFRRARGRSRPRGIVFRNSNPRARGASRRRRTGIKPDSVKKVKPGAATQDKPGTVRELARMADQFAMTYDIFNAEDAGKLWKLLPAQFDKFKGDAEH